MKSSGHGTGRILDFVVRILGSCEGDRQFLVLVLITAMLRAQSKEL